MTMASQVTPIWSKPLYRGWFLFLLTMAYALNFLDRQILSILQEPVKAELGLSDTQLGLIGGPVFALLYVGLGVPIARLSDRANRVRIISGAIGLWSIATATCGLAANFFQLAASRMTVAIGEAAATAPSYALLADLYKKEQRASAIGIFTTGTSIGSALGLALGGWVGFTYGWRSAFLIIGLPGVLLALVIFLTLREPPRGFSDGRSADVPPAKFAEVAKRALATRAFPGIAFAIGIASISGFALAHWMPSFMVRSFGLTIAEAGWRVALASGGGGLVGGLVGGFVCDRLAKRDRRWWCWAPAIAFFLNIPLMLLLFRATSATEAMLLMAAVLFLYHFWGGAGHSLIQSLVGVRMRATAAALFLMCISLIGQGLGPLVVGFASDRLHAGSGAESLRYALMATTPVWLVAGLLWLWAATRLREELDNAPE
jgi:predicted MFS family arabinose efflux permease